MKRPAREALAFATALALASCGGAQSPNPPVSSGTGSAAEQPMGTMSPIKHVIVVIEENRSFDNLFATYPGADGARYGKTIKNGKPATIKLTAAPLTERDIGHGHPIWLKEYDGGKMDGFGSNVFASDKSPALDYPYQYVDPKDIGPYWTMAKNYVLADHMFQTQGSDSFSAHQDLIAGGTAINSTESVIDSPTGSTAGLPWGCNSPPSTRVPVITTDGQEITGPYPCFSYPTLRDSLDAKAISWKYYVPPVKDASGTIDTGAIWNAFAAIKAVYDDPKEWGAQGNGKVSWPPTHIFNDIKGKRLPSMSWVVPDLLNSDHPGNQSDGPSWVASIVNAIGNSEYWNSTAIVVVWDDWGGFYDHVPPPLLDHSGGLGFRVPCLIVSPYSKKTGYVDHTQYEFGSILKFVEQNWSLKPLGTSDVRATSIGDAFDFTKPPRKFTPIPALKSQSFFERQAPSYKPVDDE